MQVDIEVRDKGRLIRVNDVFFDSYNAKYNGKNIPCSFACLLLDEKTRKAAQTLFNKALRLIHIDKAFRQILSVAGEKNIPTAMKQLEKYKQAAPNGKVGFYLSLSEDGAWKKVVVTDGKRAFAFPVGEKFRTIEYPPNVYCPEEIVWCGGDNSIVANATKEPEKFFKFLTEAKEAYENSYTFNLPATLRLFFSDRKASFEELKKAKIYKQFLTSAVKCQRGYLVFKNRARGWVRGYLITRDGLVYTFSRRNHQDMKNLVLDLLQGNEQKLNLKPEILVGSEREKVASAIGKLDPALALVFMDRKE